MISLKIYCVTNKRLIQLEKSILSLVGVGNDKFPESYIMPNKFDNIYFKEKYYSELTFHYWYWKNLMKTENAKWVGFCQKRRFWIKSQSSKLDITKSNLTDHLLVEPEEIWKNYESIICNPIKVSGVKKIKLLKRGWKNILKNPSIFFDKKKETIKLHFDMHHGYGNLDKAISLLDADDRFEFKNFVNQNAEFNPHIMFITKPEIINQWFSKLFPWLEKCEKIFGFKNLEGYDITRIYAYLAERYQSFWFKKYTVYKENPWVFIDQ
tara:strand:- start:46 stop:843 length:798 start_codon:yes stop_codon:yes gene_type:complete